MHLQSYTPPTPHYYTHLNVPSSDSSLKLLLAHITEAVRRLPNKQSAHDPIPTKLLKANIDLLGPYITDMFNRSLASGNFPSTWKEARVTLVLKKGKRNPKDVSSYRPISNLCVLSKLLERIVSRLLSDYLGTNSLLPNLQSAYRVFHSTETAMLKVSSDILTALDQGDLALLSLLDLTSAFDTVDHDILSRRLETSFGLQSKVLEWFSSFTKNRRQSIHHSTSHTPAVPIICGVPQGSVLGPILFVLYTADLHQLVHSHGLQLHAYADDIQLYGFCSPSNCASLEQQTSLCITDIRRWLTSNRLQLNLAKTELMWCASSQRSHQIPKRSIKIGDLLITPASSVRCLGLIFDSNLSMRPHVSSTVSACFGALRQIRSIRRSVTRSVLITLIVSLVHTRLDYCSAVLAGLPDCLTHRLQAVLNAGARLIFKAKHTDPVTPLLKELHWLPVQQRIAFRLSSLVYNCLQGTAPPYLAQQLTQVSQLEARERLRSASTLTLAVPLARRKTIGSRAFSVYAPRAWNRIPAPITSASAIFLINYE